MASAAVEDEPAGGAAEPAAGASLSAVVVPLLKGVTYRADDAAPPGLQDEHEQCPGQRDYRQRLTQSAGDLSPGELHHDTFASSPPPRLRARDEPHHAAE